MSNEQEIEARLQALEAKVDLYLNDMHRRFDQMYLLLLDIKDGGKPVADWTPEGNRRTGAGV